MVASRTMEAAGNACRVRRRRGRFKVLMQCHAAALDDEGDDENGDESDDSDCASQWLLAARSA